MLIKLAELLTDVTTKNKLPVFKRGDPCVKLVNNTVRRKQ